MRIISYSILETNTNTRTFVGVSYIKAEKIMEELKRINPSGDYKIVHKWYSI